MPARDSYSATSRISRWQTEFRTRLRLDKPGSGKPEKVCLLKNPVTYILFFIPKSRLCVCNLLLVTVYYIMLGICCFFDEKQFGVFYGKHYKSIRIGDWENVF